MFQFEDIVTFKRIHDTFPQDTTKTEAFFMGKGIVMPDGERFNYPKVPRNVIITGECDYLITDYVYESFRDKMKTWFATNTQSQNVHGLPLGICSKTPLDIVWKSMNKPREEKALVYMNFSIDTYPQERQMVWDLFKDKSWVTSEQSISMDIYFDQLRNHRFVLCPRGYALDTFRLWESIYLGAIPIVKYDITHKDWMDLPILFVNDWNEVTPELLASVDMAGRSIEKAKMSYWIHLIRNKKNAHMPWIK